MFLKWLKKWNLYQRLCVSDWSKYEPINISDYENQDYRTDFIFQIHNPNHGNGMCYLPELPSDPCYRLNKHLFKTKSIRRKLPITDFYGSNGGKSGSSKSLEQYANKLYVIESGQKLFNREIRFQTTADFQNNILNLEKHFRVHPLNAHYFHWSDRYYLANEDCSHTIGAIYRQCQAQGRRYDVDCQLTEWEIDNEELRCLLRAYFIFIAPQAACDVLSNIYHKTGGWYHMAVISQTGLQINFIQRDDDYCSVVEKFIANVLPDRGVFLKLEDLLGNSDSSFK